MDVIKFSTYENRIKDKLDELIVDANIYDPEGFVLVDGFVSLVLQKELGQTIDLQDSSIPSISIIGKRTGQIHHFALKTILPDLFI